LGTAATSRHKTYENIRKRSKSFISSKEDYNKVKLHVLSNSLISMNKTLLITVG
jgi:hypothetical protein